MRIEKWENCHQVMSSQKLREKISFGFKCYKEANARITVMSIEIDNMEISENIGQCSFIVLMEIEARL